MNEIYDGVITKPELNEETLTHYGIAKKVHKYIDKYLKNGKWIYRYKSKAQEAGAKAGRDWNNGNKLVTIRPTDVTTYQGRKRLKSISGKVEKSSQSGQTGSRVIQGTNAGRKRAGIQNKPAKRSRKKTITSGKVKVYKR